MLVLNLSRDYTSFLPNLITLLKILLQLSYNNKVIRFFKEANNFTATKGLSILQNNQSLIPQTIQRNHVFHQIFVLLSEITLIISG